MGQGFVDKCWVELKNRKWNWKDKCKLLQDRMLEMEIMNNEDSGYNEVEDWLWDWATEIERRRDESQETE